MVRTNARRGTAARRVGLVSTLSWISHRLGRPSRRAANAGAGRTAEFVTTTSGWIRRKYRSYARTDIIAWASRTPPTTRLKRLPIHDRVDNTVTVAPAALS